MRTQYCVIRSGKRGDRIPRKSALAAFPEEDTNPGLNAVTEQVEYSLCFSKP